jgi:NAD(P)-dependent dehydrogenase (short-subunit alcohol dehydrogenase family)
MGMLDNQVALIVGAAGGIGSAVVRRYLDEGAAVVAVDRDPERVARLKDELGGRKLLAFAADVASWEASEAMVQKAVETFGGLDVLVSCVGVYDHAIRLAEIEGPRLTAAFNEAFHANVLSMLLNIRAAIPQLAARRGRIVVTGSYASYRSAGGGVLYTAGKHAVLGLVTQLAYELAPKIRINGVAPGVAPTVMHGLSALSQAPKNSLLPGTESILPLETMPDPADYGALYALLGSATHSAAMTGSMVVADSGLLVRGIAAPNAGHDL